MAGQDLFINDQLTVPERELELQFSRSSGAGGQNVNKVNSRVELRWTVAESTALPPDVKSRLMALNRRKITKEGHLLITSQRYRDQGRNIEDAYQKLKALVEEALEVPETRVATRPGRGARERRLTEKKRTGQVKRERQTKSWDG